jgi:homoserine kinase
MPTSAEYLQLLRGCGIAAVLSGAGPAILVFSPEGDLPTEVVDHGISHGFTVSRMAVGEGVRWSSGVAVSA